MSSKSKTSVNTSDLLNAMTEDFERPFLSSASDLKAAYAVGLLLNRGMYLQRTKLRTRGLLKKLRYLLDQPNKEKVLKVFSEVNSVMIAIFSSDEQRSISSRVREAAEELLADADWSSSPEELVLALMMGFDLFSRLWASRDKMDSGDTDEQEE